jgi:hypothetical protein
MFACFGFKNQSSTPVQPPVDEVNRVISELARSMSQEMASSQGSRSSRADDNDPELFQLRLRGLDESDPEFKALKEEKALRRSLDMEAKRRSQDESFLNRLQGPDGN